MATINVCTRVLRLLAICLVALATNQTLAQSNPQPVAAPTRTITDGTTHAVVSKSNRTPVTLADGSRIQLSAAELQAYNTKPDVAVDANGKLNLRDEPVSVWIDAYRKWMIDNPSFKATLTQAEYEFIRRNNFGGLYAYTMQQARQHAARTNADKPNNR